MKGAWGEGWKREEKGGQGEEKGEEGWKKGEKREGEKGEAGRGRG